VHLVYLQNILVLPQFGVLQWNGRARSATHADGRRGWYEEEVDSVDIRPPRQFNPERHEKGTRRPWGSTARTILIESIHGNLKQKDHRLAFSSLKERKYSAQSFTQLCVDPADAVTSSGLSRNIKFHPLEMFKGSLRHNTARCKCNSTGCSF
jgi:hypothetical protein